MNNEEFFYIPKLNDGTIANMIKKLPYIIVEAHILKWRPGIEEPIKNSCENLFIDPATARFQYTVTQPDSLKELEYYQDSEGMRKLYGDATYRLENLVVPSITYQIEHGANAVIVPYFYSDDIVSLISNTNYAMVNDALIHKKHGHITQPLYVNIQIPANMLANTTQLDYVANKYIEMSNDEIEGYFITINDGDDRKLDVNSLIGLAHIIKLLSDKKVFLYHSGTFGYILSAIGLNGYISGLGQSDSYSTKNYETEMKGARGRRGWTYVTEIMAYLNDADIKKADYKCGCPICNEKTPINAKEHFLHTKLQEISDIEGLSNEELYTFLKEKLNNAKEYAKSLAYKHAIDAKVTYLDRWLDALKYFERIKPYEESDKRLEDIMSILEDN